MAGKPDSSREREGFPIRLVSSPELPATTTDASDDRLAPSPLRGGGPAGTSEFDRTACDAPTSTAGATVIAVLATEVYGRIVLVRLAVGVSLSAVVAPVATVPTLVRR
jgi:hypothetical protein